MGEKYVHVTKVRSRWGAHSTRRGSSGAPRIPIGITHLGSAGTGSVTAHADPRARFDGVVEYGRLDATVPLLPEVPNDCAFQALSLSPSVLLPRSCALTSVGVSASRTSS